MNEPTKINGLLTQKPDSPVPHVGEARRYSVTPRVSKTGKEWNKVKSEGEGYGKLYEVVTVAKTDYIDSHGNVSFNVDLIELSGGDGTHVTASSTVQSASPQEARPAAQPSVHSTSTNGAATSNKDKLGSCIGEATGILDTHLPALLEDCTPDARLDAVLRIAASLFIQGNK